MNLICSEWPTISGIYIVFKALVNVILLLFMLTISKKTALVQACDSIIYQGACNNLGCPSPNAFVYYLG